MIRWGIWPILFLTAATPVAALSLGFSNTPSSVGPNQDFSVDVNLSCQGCGDSYLRGVFYASGTNYFGFTQNNSGSWINLPGSQADQYFLVSQSDIGEGSWSGKLAVKPDPADPKYQGPGNYFFKVGRYTSGGSATWAAAVPIVISGPTPTSVPPTSAPTSKPSPTSKPTSTPRSSPSPPSPTPMHTLTPPNTPLIFPSDIPQEELVLSSSSAIITSVTPTYSSASAALSPSQGEVLSLSKDWPAYALIIFGSLVLLGSFFFKL